jgi:nitroreductase
MSVTIEVPTPYAWSPTTFAAVYPQLRRRSARQLDPEAVPTAEQLDAILHAAVTVPDHGRQQPWRLVVLQGASRTTFGDALISAAEEAGETLTPTRAEKLRAKALFSPTMIAVVARPNPASSIPRWEQVVSASCMGYAIALAADALGLGAIWKSCTHRSGRDLHRLLDCGTDDELLGWVNIGALVTTPGPVVPPRQVDLSAVVRVVDDSGRPTAYEGCVAEGGGHEARAT